MAIKSLEQWEKGYIAGVLDSDGAFLIRRIGKTFSFYCSIQFVGTFEQMEKIRYILGLHDRRIYQHGNRWMFLVGDQEDVESLIHRVWHFLTKKPEAKLIILMRKLHDRKNSAGQSGGSISQENIDSRLSIFKMYKQYKARSGGHITNWGEFEESLTDAWQASQGNHEPSLPAREEGVTTSPEIMDTSAPPEREEIV